MMEPLIPSEGKYTLSELSKNIFLSAGALANQLQAEKTSQGVAEVVRIMNSYYSNLIEGHKTYPRDIEKALKKNFSTDPEEKNNQPLISLNYIHLNLYLISLGVWFSFLTRSLQKFRWVVPLAFCFSIRSVIALNLVLLTLGIFGISVEPTMP